MDQQRLDMLKLTEAEIQKKFGTGAIMRYGDTDAKLVLDAIPTGALTLDVALGIGGIPRGRVIEVYGPESGGKTTLALHMVAEAQAMGGVAAFIDAEHALDPGYAARLGVDIDDILISQPDTGEQALEIVDMLVRSGAIDIIVIDSVAALVPRAEIEGEMGDATVGLHARLMSQALRKLTGSLSKSNTTCVFINQIREKIGGYGNPETTTGGRALKFFSSVRIEVRKKDYITDSDGPLGTHVVAKVVKNKVAPPFRIAEFDIIYGEGINKTGTILDLAASEKIVEKAGSWYSYGEDRLGQGREAAKTALEAKPEMLLEIENKVRDHYGLAEIKLGDRDSAMRPTPKPESKKKR